MNIGVKTTGNVKRKKRRNAKKVRPFTYKEVLADIFPRRKDKPAEAVRKCVFLITISIFSLCLFYITDYYSKSKENDDLYGNIADNYDRAFSGDSGSRTPSQAHPDDPDWRIPLFMLPSAERMLQQNSDYVGFIEIPDTKVKYPVVQRKGGLGDGNSYHLYRSFDGQYSKAGTIYLDWRVNFDVSENNYRATPNSENIVVYGHEMKDGQMFGSLKNYKDNYNWYENHPIIHLDSLYEQYKYKIFAVCITDTDTAEGGPDFDYYNTIELDTEQEFYNYVNECKRRSYIKNDVDITYGDQIMTLSTCNGMFPDGRARLIVVARLVRDGEDELAGTQNSSRNREGIDMLMPDVWYKYNSGTYNPDSFVPYG